jgi:hypothetical protein
MVERRQITKSLIERDPSNRLFGGTQGRRSRAQAATQNILVRRHAARMFEGPKKMVLAHCDQRGQLGKVQVAPSVDGAIRSWFHDRRVACRMIRRLRLVVQADRRRRSYWRDRSLRRTP